MEQGDVFGRDAYMLFYERVKWSYFFVIFATFIDKYIII